MLAAAAFALVAGQVSRTARSEIRSVSAERTHARLDAAAQAGFALSLAALTASDPARRWDLDEAPHSLEFANTRLTILVEDERGKIPLNTLTPAQVSTLFSASGAAPERARQLTDAFLDWRDPQRADRKSPSIGPPRSGGFLTIFELREIQGMDEATFERLQDVITVSSGDTPFVPDHASPLALLVMQGQDADSVRGIERRREQEGQKTALSTAPAFDPHARAVTLRVSAQDGRGGRADRAYLVELTGLDARPYVVRGAIPS